MLNLRFGGNRFFTPRKKTQRKAAAVVEMAVVMPILITILFGIIEFGWTFMVYQNITNAAREGCRLAVLEGASAQDVQNRVDFYMDMVGLSDYQLDLQHATADDPTETVIIRVPHASVSLLGGYFGLSNFTLAGKASMRKEMAQ